MTSTTFPVTVHEFPTGKRGNVAHAYELNFPTNQSSSGPPKNALLFIGGLSDGPHTVPYIRTIARRLADGDDGGNPSSYSVFETRLSSAFAGFGFGSLAEDVREIAAVVAYLRGTLGREKVVLMGHSTGCQDCMEYTDDAKYSNSTNAPIDGIILQAPVSDREALGEAMGPGEMAESVKLAARMIADGRPGEFMPRDMLPLFLSATPVTAYRWHSLAAVGGDDDYFSSDLPAERMQATWGRVSSPLLIVPSGNDEYVPPQVDVGGLMARWIGFCRPGIASDLSGLIPGGATHRVDPASSQEWLADRVVRFLRSLGSGGEK